MQTSAELDFNNKYITSHEVMKTLGISRTQLLYARRKGRLPNAIILNDGHLIIWERESIQTYMDAWSVLLNARRGE
jgi:predicted DNA-binding transcriptional regulator AlpA